MVNKNFKRNATGFDPTDILFHKKLQKLEFYYVPSGPHINAGSRIVSFKAFVTEYSDAFSSDWKKDLVYGRMDPIATFGGTSRTINVSWGIPSFSRQESVINLARVTSLINMLYPVYNDHLGAGQINTAPLLKLKFGNLISDQAGTYANINGGVVTNGLLGWLDGVTFAPDMDAGFFDPGDDDWDQYLQYNTAVAGGSYRNVIGNLYPMIVNLNCKFNVLHQHKLGWRKKNNSVVPNDETAGAFPYGVDSDIGSQAYDTLNKIITPKDLGQQNCNSPSYKPSGLGPITDPTCAQPQGLNPSNAAARAAQTKILSSIADMGTGLKDL